MKRKLTELAGRAQDYGRANPNVPQSLAAFAIKLVGAVLSFGFSFLVARHLGAAGNGAFALALTTAQFGSMIALFGLDYVLLRAMAGDLREGKPAAARGVARSALRVTGLAALLVGASVALFGAPALHHILGADLDMRLIWLAGIAVLPLTFNRMAIASLRGAGGILSAQWLDGPQAMLLAVAILGGIVIAGTGIDATGVVLLYFGTAALSAVVAWFIYSRKSRQWPPAASTPVIPLLAQGWRISLVVISRFVVDWLVLVSLGALTSTVEVGQFRTAWQISALIMLIVSTFDTVAGPRIAAAWRVQDIGHIRQIMRQSVATMMVISAPLFVVALGFPEWVLGLFGPEFVAAAPALRILALGQLINVLAGPVGTVMLMTGEEQVSLIVSIVALAALGLLCATLIPAFGLIGAALTTSLIIVLRTLVSWLLVRRNLKRMATDSLPK
jgi:O-antigen/teichoic acid export membrane protein